MTINQTRQKLGRLVEPIFSLNVFQNTYSMIASQVKSTNLSLATVHQYSENVNSLVAVMAEHLGDEHMLYNIVMASNPLVIYALFARYHAITQYLVAADQSHERFAPTRNRNFFIDVFIDLWREIDV